MSTALPKLFKGIAVVIDNGIGTGELIDKILANIRAGGGHAVELKSLPEDEYDLEHFARVSFFIMDWNLENTTEDLPFEAGVQLPAGLQQDMVAKNIAFLKRLSQNRHAPVFIFTNEDPIVVTTALRSDSDLVKSLEETHILVRSKLDVADKLYETLEEWGRSDPSVLTLKTWERSFVQAANDLFIDFHNRAKYWPVLLWETFGEDGVPPEVEMNRLLNRLVESRMGPSDLDLNPFLQTVHEERAKSEESYRDSMHKVLEGERFLRDERLKANIFAPGDLFEYTLENNQKSFWMNIRPECDCLRGSESLELHLLQAKAVENAETRIAHEFGAITEEKDNESIVFAMLEGVTYSIKLKDVKVKTIKQIQNQSGKRVGRLLPPFITRVQQRYAAYVQRPGMPRIPSALYASRVTATTVT